MSKSLSLRFVELLQSLVPTASTPAVRAMASTLVADGLAVAALGAGEPGPTILAGLARGAGGRPEASLVGRPGRVPAAWAARVNGAAMHVLDYEPMWNPANHALSTTLPALAALTEQMALGDDPLRPAPNGAAVLTALAIGIEAQERLRAASGQLEPGRLRFHPPGAVGAIGSAMACGLLLGLDAESLAHAIGIAASRACGVQANVGSMTKALHCGEAAMAGLESALLAAHGFTADADALGGERGYGRAFYGDDFSAERLLELRPGLYVTDPGPAFKLYPSQYGTHFVIDAMMGVRRQLHGETAGPLDGAAVEAIEIVSPPMPYVHRPRPATGLAGKFSFQYVAVVALLDGRVDVRSFTDTRRFAAEVERLLDRVKIVVDPSREGRFDRMRVDVRVRLAGGRCAESACDGPPGIWGRPADPALLVAKARDCASAVFGPARAADLLDIAGRLESLDGAAAAACFREWECPAI